MRTIKSQWFRAREALQDGLTKAGDIFTGAGGWPGGHALTPWHAKLVELLGAMPKVEDPAPVEEQLAKADTINRHVRNKLEAAKLKEEADKLERQSKNLTLEMDEIDAEKDKRTKAAKLPVDGLAFDNARLLYKGLPFEQASYAVKLKVSFSMAMAMNPKLRICLIRDGAMLDDKNRAALIEMAKEAQAQVWLEIVGEKGATVIMEDGAVKVGK